MLSRGKTAEPEMEALDSHFELKIQSMVRIPGSSSSSQDGNLEEGSARTQTIDNEDPNLVSDSYQLSNLCDQLRMEYQSLQSSGYLGQRHRSTEPQELGNER